VICSLALSGVAFADDGATAAGPAARRGGGEVIAVGADNFTVRTRHGAERVIYVDGSTKFMDKDGNPLTFADLKVGSLVIGTASRHDDGKWYAETVRVLPPRTNYKGVGVASAVEDDEFTFVSRGGKVWEFYVDSATQFSDRQGNPLTYADVKVGARLFVQAELRSDGKWWATGVKIGRPQAAPPSTP
jgi:hypothetical protein